MQLILATRNPHKRHEIAHILQSDVVVRDLTAYPEVPEIEENGASFEENATFKASKVSKQLPGLVVADDSGLEVDALGGAPGIYSARYAGRNASDKDNIAKLLVELAKVNRDSDHRRARFRCVLAAARDGRVLSTVEGIVKGRIAEEPRGSHGFGYDPVFVPEGFEETFAEMSGESKNKISHRANAICNLHSQLPILYGKF
jgi:XTP/dITP diphosphohydrolase